LKGNFAVAQDGIYFIPGPVGVRPSIQFLSFVSGKTTIVADVGDPGFNLSVSPDSKGTSWILYGHHEPFTANLMLIENFR
jgi:hypothetical protein